MGRNRVGKGAGLRGNGGIGEPEGGGMGNHGAG